MDSTVKNFPKHILHYFKKVKTEVYPMEYFQDASITEIARRLRKNLSPKQKRVWEILRCRKIDGLKFRRQYPIHPYIVDFACSSIGLAIDIHDDNEIDQEYEDLMRRVLKRKGFTYISFKKSDLPYGKEEHILRIVIDDFLNG